MYDLRCAKECWNTAFYCCCTKSRHMLRINDDLLSYEWVESTQGPPRKYYNLTPQGEIFLSGLETAWEELTNTVNHLKNN